MKAQKTSKLGKLDRRQWVKGLVVTVVTGVLSVIKTSVFNSSGIDPKEVGLTALTCGIGYVVTSLSHNSDGKYLSKDTEK